MKVENKAKLLGGNPVEGQISIMRNRRRREVHKDSKFA